MEKVDSQVVKEAGRFALMCSTLTTGHPYITLDFTWPSVGTVDYLLYPLRGKKDLTPEEFNLINIASSYLTFIAYKSWSFFQDDLKVAIAKRENGDSIISVSGGRYLSQGEKFEVNVSQALFQILSPGTTTIKVFPDHTRNLPPSHNFLSSFALGLFTGLTPYGEGKWNTLFPIEFEPYLVSAKNFLSVSTADFYSRAFPEENLGKLAELYQADLILLPCEYQEDFPAMRSTTGFLTHLIKKNIDREQIYSLALNLLSIPDELISSTAFAVLTALTEDEPEPRLQAYAENFAPFIYKLRPAVLLARDAFSPTIEWSRKTSEEEVVSENEALKLNLFTIEKKLQLLPLLFLDYDICKKPELENLVQELIWGHLHSSIGIINDSAELKQIDEVVVQQIFLELLMDRVEQAGNLLKEFWKPRGQSYRHPEQLLLLAGLYHLQNNDIEQAENFFAQAYKLLRKSINQSGKPFDVSILLDISVNYINILLDRDELELAQEVIHKIQTIEKNSVRINLAQIIIHERKNEVEQKNTLLNTLFEYAIPNRIIFDFLVDSNKTRLLKERPETSS